MKGAIEQLQTKRMEQDKGVPKRMGLQQSRKLMPGMKARRFLWP
jgi:hypothetical protein